MRYLTIMLGLLVGCSDSTPTIGGGWTYVGTCDGGYIYKKRFESEHATFYYMHNRYGSLSVVKD